MKKQLFQVLLCGLMLLPMTKASAQSTVDAGQTTEGQNFWVTFLQADHRDGDDKDIILSLTVSSRSDCEVTIDNPYFPGKNVDVFVDGVAFTEAAFPFSVSIVANQATEIQLYQGTAKTTNQYNEFCYTRRGEQVDSTALHVTSTAPISLFASNYKEASFDAANVLPVIALQKDYLIQCYTPSDHGNKPQGSHFAIVAVEDGTVAEYTLSVATDYHQKGATVKTDTLKAGQVWYVWTGDGEGHGFDLSGTSVTANKPIAVFQGNPHTNLPFYADLGLDKPIQQRDHLFSQAMATPTWGTTFAVTRSARKRDVIRIMAIDDGTEVKINGVLRHTFDFSQEPQQYWEIQLGDAITNGGKDGNETRPDAEVPGGSCFIETSCPCGVHLFIVSQEWDGKRNNNDGDPSMLWVNPIEQKIDQITFSTYSSKNSKGSGTKHYVNVVTDSLNVRTNNRMLLDGSALTGWEPVVGSDNEGDGEYRYYYVRHDLGTTAKNSKPLSHTLKLDNAEKGEGFIAYVYGYTSNESYGYNAGGSTKPLTQYITINGKVFTPDTQNTLCGEDNIRFACHPDYEWEKIVWNFGDGHTKTVYEEKDSVVFNYYEQGGVYDAYVLIYRKSSSTEGKMCSGQNKVDSIPIEVTIGRYSFEIVDVDVPCYEEGKPWYGKIYYSTGGAKVNLTGDNVSIKFDDVAKTDGFKDDELIVKDGYFQITIHKGQAQTDKVYGIDVKITSDCGGTDTTLNFSLNFDNDIIKQRYTNILGLDSTMAKYILSDFQWYRVSDSTAVAGQVSSNLNFYDLPSSEFKGDRYYVCFTMNKGTDREIQKCACAKGFDDNGDKPNFDQNPDKLVITATYVVTGRTVFVNADWGDKTDIECYAQWIKVDGTTSQQFNIPDGGCTIPTPNDNGLYLLRVTTDGGARTFKFMVNK